MPPLDLGNPYAPLLHRRETVIKHILNWPDSAFGDEDTQAGFDKAGLLANVATGLRLPRLLVSGGFDAGKTFLCKKLIGDPPHDQGGLLRSNYAPETKMITVIIHIDHRPPWLTQPVALMSAAFDLDRLYDQRHFKAELLLAGDRSLIDRYAVHQKQKPGDAGSGNPHGSDTGYEPTDTAVRAPENAVYCLVFMAAPLLRSLILLDPPGFDSGMVLDQERARKMAGLADIVIFLSQFVGFLNARDFGLLAEQVRALQLYSRQAYPGMGAFRNLYVVATHARQRQHDIDHVLSEGARRLWGDSERSSKLLQRRATDAGEAQRAPGRLLERFFAFYPDYPFTREPLREDLADLLSVPFPQAFNRRAKTATVQTLEAARLYYARRVTRLEEMLSGRRLVGDEVRLAETAQAQVDILVARYSKRLEEILTQARRAGLDAANQVADELYDPVRVEQMLRGSFDSFNKATQNCGVLIKETIQGRLEAALKDPILLYRAMVREFAREVVTIDLSLTGTTVNLNDEALVTGLAEKLFGGAMAGLLALDVAIIGTSFSALAFLGPIGVAVAIAVIPLVAINHFATRWQELAGAVVAKFRAGTLRASLHDAVEATCVPMREQFTTLTSKVRADRLADLARKQRRSRQTISDAMACFRRERDLAEENRLRVEALQRSLKDGDR
ncbi:hypothetical protein [Azospirillum sp. RU38E]|uniref:hypothetical protein n=2 Tax=unclassified Azospirillum TaxID=2630922 RepID=UPI00135854A6|nr:hypothetical protein [Azospirillum sp. RU38E]